MLNRRSNTDNDKCYFKFCHACGFCANRDLSKSTVDEIEFDNNFQTVAKIKGQG